MYQPFVSIVMPAYNEEKRINKCLSSIGDLKYPKEKIEIIVVDDGSHDNTLDIAHKYHARVIRQNHLGCASARNRGAEYAKGELIGFIDADDICKSEWLSESIKFLNDRQIGAVGCSHDLLNAERSDFVVISFKEKRYRHAISSEKTDHIGASGCVIKKSVFQEVGGFNPRFTAAEDAEISHRIRKMGYELVLIKMPLIGVTYPNRISRYFSTQIRNSAFFVLFISMNAERLSGNKYSGLLDYIQSIIPTIFILFFFYDFHINFILFSLISIFLILINIKFFLYLANHNEKLSKYWFLSTFAYIITRSVAWNIGLLYGLFLRVSKKSYIFGMLFDEDIK